MSKEAMLTAEVVVLTELVRVLSDKVNELEAKQEQGEPVEHCEAGPNYCWKCLEEAKPTYGSEEIRKLREVIKNYTTPQQRKPLTDEVSKLRGEIGVLVGLLGAALQVIDTVDGEDATECEMLMELHNKITYAIQGALT
jgi:hypothetical protein